MGPAGPLKTTRRELAKLRWKCGRFPTEIASSRTFADDGEYITLQAPGKKNIPNAIPLPMISSQQCRVLPI